MKPVVYFAPFEMKENIEVLLAKLALGCIISKDDFVSIKLHFGEKGNKGFINPQYVKRVVHEVHATGAKAFLTDTNTIYVGERADAVSHFKMAEGHGFSFSRMGAPVIIAGGLRGNAGVEVEIRQKHFTHVSIAQDIMHADGRIFLTHFKGHELTGFGGTLKNMGMGCATRKGKYAMHDSISPRVMIEKCTGCSYCIAWCPGKALSLPEKKIHIDRAKCIGCGECILACKQKVFNIPWNEAAESVQERVVEYASGLPRNKNLYINFLHHITPECDCFPTRTEPVIADIGILASTDPVALDQASVDMVNKKAGKDLIREMHPEIDYTKQLIYAEQLGLGSRTYDLEKL